MSSDVTLLDSGLGQKLERFGPYTLIRPCPQAVWRQADPEAWRQADAAFSRQATGGKWDWKGQKLNSWRVEVGGLRFVLQPTDFGHLGLFPEHAALWTRVRAMTQPKSNILNLFAYSGGMTLAVAQAGAKVCHLDSAKGMVEWAKENAACNQLQDAPIRWIVDDAMKFLKREVKRNVRYDGIILDPPTFGRGTQGEVFKIESDLHPLLALCKELLSPHNSFLVLSCHTPGFTPLVLEHLLKQLFGPSSIETGELTLPNPTFPISSGCYAIKTY